MAKKNVKSTAADPPWLQQCIKNINQIPGGTLCSEQHCKEAAAGGKKICNCEPPYLNGCLNNPVPGCCSYAPSSPVYVALPGGGCYCCCGSFAAYTTIAVAKNDSIPADQLKKGDTIYAPKDTELRQWASVPLQFVSLSNTSAENPQVSIDFNDEKGKMQTLIVGAKQLVMLPGKKFKEARKLVPGFDQLVNNNGKAVDIESLNTGVYTPFIAYLSSFAAPASDPAEHLLSLNGIIAGDYSLTLGIGAQHLCEGHEQLPNAGTAAYKQRYPHLY